MRDVSLGDTRFLINEQILGQNIRALRAASGESLDVVARRAGITKSTLSKIENGQTSSPIATLLAIAKALGVRISDFFREEESPRWTLTRKGKGLAIVRDGSRLGYSYEALAAEFPGKPAEPFLLTVSPGDKEGRFQHPGHEFIHLLSGRIAFTVGDDRLEMGPGDSLYFDATIPHRLKLLGKAPARFLCLFIA